MSRLHALLSGASVFALVLVGSAQADELSKWKTSDGRTVYGNEPPEDARKLETIAPDARVDGKRRPKISKPRPRSASSGRERSAEGRSMNWSPRGECFEQVRSTVTFFKQRESSGVSFKGYVEIGRVAVRDLEVCVPGTCVAIDGILEPESKHDFFIVSDAMLPDAQKLTPHCAHAR